MLAQQKRRSNDFPIDRVDDLIDNIYNDTAIDVMSKILRSKS